MSKKYILFSIIAVSLLWSLALAVQRYSWEKNNNSVALAIDADGLYALALTQGLTFEQTVAAVKAAGGTALGVTEDTLSSLRNRGLIELTYGNQTNRIFSSPRCTYVLCSGKDLAANLAARFSRLIGVDKVKLFSEQGDWIVRLTIINPDLEETAGLGFSQELLNTAQQHGLKVVLRPYSLEGLTEIKEWSNIPAVIFAGKYIIFYPQTFTILTGIPARIGQIEFTNQIGMDRITAIPELQQKIVRVHSLSEKEIQDILAEKRKVTMESLIDRWLRAVKERNVRLLYIHLFPKDIDFYYIRQIAYRLNESGFQVKGLSGRIPVATNRVNIGITGLGVWALAILILWFLFPQLNQILRYIFLGLMLLHVLLTLVVPSLWYARMLALAASILFPLWSYLWLQNRIERNLGPGYFKTAWIFSLASLLSLAGASYIIALLFGSYFWQKIGSFAGIKLALTLPLLLMLWHGLRQEKDYLWKSFWEQTVTYKHLLLVALVTLGVVMYLWRSGNNGALFITPGEEKLRLWLDQVLLVRPRTKEIFFGHPLLMLGIYLGLKKRRNLLAVVAGFVGQLSLVNTFCHVHTPLTVSLWRVFNGWWLGLVIGWWLIWCYQKYLITNKTGEQLCLKF